MIDGSIEDLLPFSSLVAVGESPPSGGPGVARELFEGGTEITVQLCSFMDDHGDCTAERTPDQKTGKGTSDGVVRLIYNWVSHRSA